VVFIYVPWVGGSAVGIATGYVLDDWVVGVRVLAKNFLFLQIVHTGSGVHQTSYPVGLKQPGREADHSPPASAEVKKIWICDLVVRVSGY
jgi:hypothetical protein